MVDERSQQTTHATMASNTMVSALEIVLDVVDEDDASKVLMFLATSSKISSELTHKKQEVIDRIQESFIKKLTKYGDFMYAPIEDWDCCLPEEKEYSARFKALFTLPGIKDNVMLLCIKYITDHFLYFGHQLGTPYGFDDSLRLMEEELGLNATINNILIRWDESDVFKSDPSGWENAKKIVNALDNLYTPEKYDCPPNLFIDYDW